MANRKTRSERDDAARVKWWRDHVGMVGCVVRPRVRSLGQVVPQLGTVLEISPSKFDPEVQFIVATLSGVAGESRITLAYPDDILEVIRRKE